MQKNSDPINDFVRQRIREIRKRKKLSVRKTAELSGIPESSYSCLENGFYRITLHNLQKILAALHVGVEEVWPPEQVYCNPVSPLDPAQMDYSGYFRFQEVVSRTCAKQACLVYRSDRSEMIYSSNLNDREVEGLMNIDFNGEKEIDGWQLFKATAEDGELYLCLKNATVNAELQRLIGTYLDLWIVMQL